MPHHWDWQGGQMPLSSAGVGGWAQLELTDALLGKDFNTKRWFSVKIQFNWFKEKIFQTHHMIVMDVMIVMVRQNLVEKKLANRKYLETT